VPSARRTTAACVATLPLAIVLTGCVSTQQIAARARLVSARELASQSTTEVGQANPNVTVDHVALILARSGTAVVVSLRNNTSTTLTDLPISIGVRSGHRELYLNRSANLDYFASHVAALGPHGAADWVFTTARRIADGRPVATVGFPDLHPSLAGSLPRLDVTPDGAARVTVSNHSTIPQYDLQVYVVAKRAGRYVGAGIAQVPHLGTRATTSVRVTFIGVAQGVTLKPIAVPTIFN
jgi:hypothetical protein